MGGVVVFTAIALPVLFGFVSLGVEVGHWYLVQREMQGAADAAAISAAAEYIAQNQSGTSYRTVGVQYAALNGFTITASDVCLVTSSGNNCDATHPTPIVCATPPCIVVDFTRAQKQMFLPIPEPTLPVRSIVDLKVQTTTTSSSGDGCVLGLSQTQTAVVLFGNGNLQAPNCAVASDTTTTTVAGLTLGTGGKAGFNVQSIYFAQPPLTPPFVCNSSDKCSTGSITHNSYTQDPYALTRHFDAPPTPPYVTVTISPLTTGSKTAKATLGANQTLPFSSGNQVTIVAGSPYGGSFPVTVTSSTTFTYAVGTALTAPATPVSPATSVYAYKVGACVAFTNGANNPGGTASNPKCYLGGTTSGNTTFNPYTYFLGPMSVGGTTVFDGTPTSDGFYVFDGGVTFMPNGNSTLGAGIYYVKGPNGVTFGNKDVICGVTQATADKNCPYNSAANGGVTFVMTSSALYGSQGQVTANGQDTIELTALCTDATCSQNGGTKSNQIGSSDTSGLVFFADPSTTTGGFNFQGQENFAITGAMYFPNQTVSMTGQATFASTPCTQLIANIIQIGGNGSFANGCLPFGGSTSTTETTTTQITSPRLYQ
jgi:hypothetical protein